MDSIENYLDLLIDFEASADDSDMDFVVTEDVLNDLRKDEKPFEKFIVTKKLRGIVCMFYKTNHHKNRKLH